MPRIMSILHIYKFPNICISENNTVSKCVGTVTYHQNVNIFDKDESGKVTSDRGECLYEDSKTINNKWLRLIPTYFLLLWFDSKVRLGKYKGRVRMIGMITDRELFRLLDTVQDKDWEEYK